MFIIDSLNYSHLKESPLELMPFLKKLEQEGVSCENMYSQAPYTEAAVMNIYCGQNVLDYGGYMYRFRDTPLTLFEAMREMGYSTYYNSYQPQCHPSSVKRGVDYLYYNVGYDQGALWSYRISHFSGLYKAGELDGADRRTLLEIFDDNFREWRHFVSEMAAEEESTALIAGNTSDYHPGAVGRLLEEEYRQYCKDKGKYLESVLEKGSSHPFFRIPAYRQDRKIKDRKFMKEWAEEMRPLFRRIKRLDAGLNLKNAGWKILGNPFRKTGAFLKSPNKANAKDMAKSLFYSANYLFDFDLYDRISEDYDSFKNAPSVKSHIDHYFRWVKTQKTGIPHFACIHVDDVHNPEIFFTYDSTDLGLLGEEKEMAETLLDNLPSDYYGSITHDLSLRYIDRSIAYLFRRLEKEGMLEDTYVAICADHGFSFSGNPVRDSFVSNLYLENFNIPFIIYGRGLAHRRFTQLCTSKDIPPTLCRLLGGTAPPVFSGHDLFGEEKYPALLIEYCGGGCPDMRRRELKIAAFDENWFVGTLAKLSDDLDGGVTEIYHLSRDPRQEHNLVNRSYDREKTAALLEVIRKRRSEMQEWLDREA